MRLALNNNRRLWDLAKGDIVNVDIANYRRDGDKDHKGNIIRVEPKLVEATVVTGYQKLTIMVGNGEKVHSSTGVEIAVTQGGRTHNHWFGASPFCQEYRGKGANFMYVSASHSVNAEYDAENVTCKKCLGERTPSTGKKIITTHMVDMKMEVLFSQKGWRVSTTKALCRANSWSAIIVARLYQVTCKKCISKASKMPKTLAKYNELMRAK
jgi:hypothetical protein